MFQGFDRDHPFDLEVRDEYQNRLCQEGVDFTVVDHLSEGLSKPPTFEEVEFEAPEYPDDPDLTFETLPLHTFVWPEDGLYYKGTRSGYDAVASMELAHHHLEYVAKYAEMAHTHLVNKAESTCDAKPYYHCTPVAAGNGGCMFYPGKQVCEAATYSFTTLYFVLWKLAELGVEVLAHTIFYVSKFVFW